MQNEYSRIDRQATPSEFAYELRGQDARKKQHQSAQERELKTPTKLLLRGIGEHVKCEATIAANTEFSKQPANEFPEITIDTTSNG